ncbi:hypothetical protein DPMN_121680 [Dreissena polymorpha]|uniref:Uncharacterized protein n=1 Tax=Dreissena polymorpha TaxID=45954 RepID=A0A9D4JPS3_DREPO|nr:hypothetical protein DPMN_121680 [Dreissena polymorpha]
MSADRLFHRDHSREQKDLEPKPLTFGILGKKSIKTRPQKRSRRRDSFQGRIQKFFRGGRAQLGRMWEGLDDCIDALSGAKFFSSMDLNSGYWQRLLSCCLLKMLQSYE